VVEALRLKVQRLKIL